jgi:hypothetical protein
MEQRLEIVHRNQEINHSQRGEPLLEFPVWVLEELLKVHLGPHVGFGGLMRKN